MTKQDIIRKLTSRKFWVAICEFVAMLIVALGGTQDKAVTITALIMAGATAIAYLLAEGLTDAKGANTANTAILAEHLIELEPNDNNE